MSVNAEQHIFRSPKFRGVVGEAIQFFETTPLHDLPPSDRFTGCGVYALYYLGNCDLYAPLARANRKTCTRPIYVGKAVPAGWRA